MIMRFNRKLQKHVTKTGIHYVLSIPREVAQDLQLEAGGLCSIKVKGRAEVVLKPYQDDPLYILHFNLEGHEIYGEPFMKECPLENPITKGRSQAVYKQQFKPFRVASNLALKYIKTRLDIMRSTKSGRAALENAFRKRGF
jgi:bifunctional DNA-binding transcriptional regulator/antitoxin component of YhaV-PrlF toxin-antitoxin module